MKGFRDSYRHLLDLLMGNIRLESPLGEFLASNDIGRVPDTTNILSLFQNDKAESAEFKIAKVAVTNVLLWACIWSPYAFVVFLAGIGSKGSITPLVSQLPSFFAKLASCLNPIVYAVSHPK